MRNKRTKPNNQTRWPPEVREATKHLAETQDPPSQDPGDHNSGITSHLCNTKQTPTTPGHIVVVKIEEVKQAVKNEPG